MVFWTMAAPVRRPSEENSMYRIYMGIPDYLDNAQFIDPPKRNPIIFDDLMTEAKCDRRIVYLFTKGSHHRKISNMYLTQGHRFKYAIFGLV